MDAPSRHTGRWLGAVALCIALAATLQVVRLALPGDGCQAFPSPQGLWVTSCLGAGAAVSAALPHDVNEVAGHTVDEWLAAPLDGRPQARYLSAPAGPDDGGTILIRDVRGGALALDMAYTLRPWRGLPAVRARADALLAGLAFLALGAWVFRRRGDPASRMFLLLGASYLAVALLTGLWFYQPSDLLRPELFWLYTAVQLPACWLAASTMLHFTLIFPTRKRLLAGPPWSRFWPHVAVPVAVLLAALSGYRIDLAVPVLEPAGDPGSLHTLIALVWDWTFKVMGLMMLGTAAALVHSFLATRESAARHQLRWVTWGVAVGLAPMLVWVEVGDVPGVPLEHLAYLFTLLIPLAFTVSILRYRLWDIDVLVNRVVVYALVMLLLGFLYLAIYAVIGTAAVWLAGPALRRIDLDVAIAAGSLASAFAFLPVRDRVQRAVDRLLFPAKHARAERLAELSRALARLVSIDELIALLVEQAPAALSVARAWLLLPDRGGSLAVARSAGSRPEVDASLCFEQGHPVLAAVTAAGEGLELAAAEAGDWPHGSPATETLREGVSRLRAAGVALAMSLIAERRLIGLYLLGPQDSGESYDRDDVRQLRAFARHAAIALRNAELHRELLDNERHRERLARYFSPRVAERVLGTGAEPLVSAEHLPGTVLFTDVRGFTGITERLAPDVLTRMLNQHLDALTRTVFAYEGTLLRYTGDGLMAVFGTPLPQPDHALRAVQAAIAMRAAHEELKLAWSRAGLPSWDIGLGIGSGTLTAGNFGSAERLEYTVIGSAATIAARLTARAAPGQILVTQGTLDCCGTAISARPLSPLMLRGMVTPVQAYEVLEVLHGLSAGNSQSVHTPAV